MRFTKYFPSPFRLFSCLASAALITACSAGSSTDAEPLGDGLAGSAEQALGSAPNLALGKPASQSSMYLGGGGDAWRAVDGNTNGNWGNGSVTHTDDQSQPWWQVDLQGSHSLSTVVINNRTDCCSERLQNFRVRVSEDGVTWQDYPFAGIAPVQSTFTINRSARYVRVQLDGTNALSLAEVQVFPSASNIALGKPASQSSMYLGGGGDAWRAVDGNTNGNWGNGSVTHTDNQSQPWWQVDLQGVNLISTVVLNNRTDCCSERLQNFRVRVSADGVNWQDYPFAGIAPVQSIFAINHWARYVRVQLDGTGVLSLAEVQVFTPAAQQLISVDAAGCNTNVAINNAIGQSFRVSSATSLEKIEVWIKPELYYTTSYALEVYDGEGTSGTKLATSQTTLTLGSQTAGTPSGFHGFSFAGQALMLQPNKPYTFRLARLSDYSGAFAKCGNVYPNGIQYWLGYSPDSPYDVSFKLYGMENTPPMPPIPPPAGQPLISIDIPGCSTNVAINNAIGQSFRVSSATNLEKIAVWIKPELYYMTSYALEVYDGEGTSGTKLATSQTTLTLGSQSSGKLSDFYGFSFAGQGIMLQPNQPYTFRLVRLSEYSGTFSKCGNVYPNGIQYWLGYSPDSPYDVSFKLYGS